ncbi:MAG: hypothetical protein FJ301_04160 [Planctomycetes bacterium]|nr:hypothetical protein [Planctomycetota bacterium]
MTVAPVNYVLPAKAPLAAPRLAGDRAVVSPQRDLNAAFRRGSDVAKALGERFLAAAENHRVFLDELRQRIQALDGAIAEATRAQIKGALHGVLDILGWCDAAEGDVLANARLAATGAEPIDVAALCEEVAQQHTTSDRPIYVHGSTSVAWWGSAAALAETVRQALALVAERTQSAGARSLEVRETPAGVQIECAAAGAPGYGVESASVDRFRRAVGATGGAVLPGAQGAGSAALVIALPKRQDVAH